MLVIIISVRPSVCKWKIIASKHKQTRNTLLSNHVCLHVLTFELCYANIISEALKKRATFFLSRNNYAKKHCTKSVNFSQTNQTNHNKIKYAKRKKYVCMSYINKTNQNYFVFDLFILRSHTYIFNILFYFHF